MNELRRPDRGSGDPTEVGCDPEAAAWEQKRDALLAELRRRAGAPALPIEGIVQLAVACAQAGRSHEPLGADVEEALASISKWPAPLDTLVPFLRSLAAGEVPGVPGSLPGELTDALGQVLSAVGSAGSG